MQIDSSSNPTVKFLRGLASSAKQRREGGEFLAEGVRVVQDALDAGHVPHTCLYDPAALEKTGRGRDLLGRLSSLARAGSSHIYEATGRALEAAGDTQHPQGVVASFKIPAWPVPQVLQGAPLVLICDDIQDAGNLGTILRTCEAAGVRAVWLTPRCVDLYSPKVVRAGMGAHFRLPSYPDAMWDEIAQGLAALGIPATNIYAAESEAQHAYDQVDWATPSALIVSNEAHGLGDEARRLAEGGGGLVTIPMSGGTESLNAAVAAAVILFEAARQRRTDTPTQKRG